MSKPVVVDLSHHNPTPDWEELKSGGIVGVIHKATEGSSYVDDTLFGRASDAMKADLAWSTYHFLRPGSVVDQIDHYLNTTNPVFGERVCLDYEDAGVSLSMLKDCVQYLHEERPDLQITIYSGHLIKERLGSKRDEFLADHTSLWIAHYTDASVPVWPKETWPVWSLWQFTDRATVPGISAPVDGNRFNGSPENCVKWFGPVESPQPSDQVVKVAIEAPDDVQVSVTVNGEML